MRDLRADLLESLERPSTKTTEDLLNLLARAYQKIYLNENLFVNGEYVSGK